MALQAERVTPESQLGVPYCQCQQDPTEHRHRLIQLPRTIFIRVMQCKTGHGDFGGRHTLTHDHRIDPYKLMGTDKGISKGRNLLRKQVLSTNIPEMTEFDGETE